MLDQYQASKAAQVLILHRWPLSLTARRAGDVEAAPADPQANSFPTSNLPSEARVLPGSSVPYMI
ncbi:hypothetical protein N7456_004809 [Penicillium angulare]|uniref:Uncharacterized protein n=1 Tax=Penicillium angulare TaxID=116970 RepID=A0A9W9KIQ6_9EURO|nr:hypothetical protein N7456_004809 [Penicillium angulare]